MKPLSIILFTVASINIAVFMGNQYSIIHISRFVWIVITGLSIAAFLISYIADMIKGEKTDEEQ